MSGKILLHWPEISVWIAGVLLLVSYFIQGVLETRTLLLLAAFLFLHFFEEFGFPGGFPLVGLCAEFGLRSEDPRTWSLNRCNAMFGSWWFADWVYGGRAPLSPGEVSRPCRDPLLLPRVQDAPCILPPPAPPAVQPGALLGGLSPDPGLDPAPGPCGKRLWPSGLDPCHLLDSPPLPDRLPLPLVPETRAERSEVCLLRGGCEKRPYVSSQIRMRSCWERKTDGSRAAVRL